MKSNYATQFLTLIVAFVAVSYILSSIQKTLISNSCVPVYEFIKKRTLGNEVRIFGKREVKKYASKLPADYCSAANIQKQTVEPMMSQQDKSAFHYYLSLQLKNNRDCMTYVEWGSGGSTFVALQYAHRVISIENYAEWCGIILQSPQVICNIITGQLVFVCVDGGPVAQFGTPKDMNNYNSSHYIDVMQHFTDLEADFVLIDGRFRVATGLASMRNSKPDSVMMFHDYKKWSDYWIIEKFFNKLPIPENMNATVFGAFSKKKSIDRKFLEEQQKFYDQKSH